MALRLNLSYLKPFIQHSDYIAFESELMNAHTQLHSKVGAGNEFLGWLDLPKAIDTNELSNIKKAAEKIKGDTDVLIVIGIGGSYLGARAAVELLKSSFYNQLPKSTPNIYFVGNNLSADYLNEILTICKDKELSLNVISKSGTTTEPAIAFRVFKELMEQKYGKEGAKHRIYCTTDKSKGTLKELADKEGYQTFVIPDDIGGRYSVLTAVGLLPIAVCGADIDTLLQGAVNAMEDFSQPNLHQNACYQYAVARNILYRKGKTIEMLVSYEPSFMMMSEWFKQLFGESEGKEHKGIFPASAIFSTDLHSLGQFIQDGTRSLFETVIDIKEPRQNYFVEESVENFDGLNFLANQNLSEINRRAFEGTILAHTEGGTPNIVIELPKIDEFELGYLIYFFEKACAISGYILGVNPFDQPGVEGYKKNMFALLGKKGYEALRAELTEKLN